MNSSKYQSENRDSLHQDELEEDDITEFWSSQCQKYEERIVELHSVIAELTRKLEDTNDVIKEESEFEENSVITDSCIEDEGEDEIQQEHHRSQQTGGRYHNEWTDKASLAFEQALSEEEQEEEEGIEDGSGSDYEHQQHEIDQDILFKIELFDEMEKELFESRSENERLQAVISEQEKSLEEASQAMEQLKAEKDAAKRQLEDLQATLEFQEAKMDQGVTGSSSLFLRSSSVGGERRRRSLRRKKGLKTDSPTATAQTSSKPPIGQYHTPVSSTPSPVSNRSFNPITRSMSHEETKGLHKLMQRCQIGGKNYDKPNVSRGNDLTYEFERLKSHASHVESHNQVLSLSLEDSKSLNDQLSVILSKRESNESALTLSLHYCDAIIEAYDVLVALLETENSMLQSSDLTKSDETGSLGSAGSNSQRARSQRRSAEKVARHLLNRLDRSLVSIDGPTTHSTSGSGGRQRTSPLTRRQVDLGLSSPTGCWEDSSGYSHTTSSTTSTTSASSCHIHNNHIHSMVNCDGSLGNNSLCLFTRNDEVRLRECISQLKTIRASIQSTVAEVESVHSELTSGNFPINHANQSRLRQLELEEAVMRQELMASREEKADLRAKVYLLEKEKTGLKMILQDRDCMEEVLRTRILHLEEILDPNLLGELDEQVLRQRINNLFDTLDKVSRNANERHKHAIDLIEDLRKANSTLTEALERSKRKYQSKLKKMEVQIYKEENKKESEK